MARDHARFYVRMWGETDWRSLHPLSQWLFMHLIDDDSGWHRRVAAKPPHVCEVSAA